MVDKGEIFYQRDGITVRRTEFRDICELKDRLAPEIIAEVQASHDHDPERALINSYLSSDLCLTAEKDGRAMAIFGTAPWHPDQPEVGSVWLLASQDLLSIPKSVMLISVASLDLFFQRYSVLHNFVDARFDRSIKWLKRLGAEFQDPAPWGAQGLPFCRFTLTKEGF